MIAGLERNAKKLLRAKLERDRVSIQFVKVSGFILCSWRRDLNNSLLDRKFVNQRLIKPRELIKSLLFRTKGTEHFFSLRCALFRGLLALGVKYNSNSVTKVYWKRSLSCCTKLEGKIHYLCSWVSNFYCKLDKKHSSELHITSTRLLFIFQLFICECFVNPIKIKKNNKNEGQIRFFNLNFLTSLEALHDNIYN